MDNPLQQALRTEQSSIQVQQFFLADKLITASLVTVTSTRVISTCTHKSISFNLVHVLLLKL